MRNWTENKINQNIYIIRHGKTPGNAKQQYIGITDECLSEAGREELQNRLNEAYYPTYEAGNTQIFVSPMKRCVETAQILYGACEVCVVEEFAEMNFGVFERKNYQELNGNAIYQEWVDSGCVLKIPQGESMEEFSNRIMRGWNRMQRSIKKETTKVIVIAHGGTIMAITHALTNCEFYKYHVKNGEMKQLTWENDKWNIY